MENYEISLGIDIDKEQLNNVKNIVKSIEGNEHKIVFDIDFEIKNINRLTNVSKEIEKLQAQFKELGNVDLSNKVKSSISVDSTALEKSMKNIYDSIKKVRNSLGNVDSKRGVQSLLTTVNHISKSLEKVSSQFENLNKNLTSLSSKDFGINIDLGLNNSSKDPQQQIKELNMLKKEVEEYENYFRKFLKISDGSVDPISRLMVNYNQRDRMLSHQYLVAMNQGSDAKKIAAHKEYLNLIKKTAKMANISIEPVEFRLAESGEFIRLRNEASEAEKQLKELFSGGIDAENLHRILNLVSEDLNDIKTSLQALASKNPIDGLTQSFDRLSNILDKLDASFDKIKNNIGNSLISSGAVQSVQQTLQQTDNQVVQSAQQTGKKIGESINKSIKQSLDFDDVIDKEVLKLMKYFDISTDDKNAFNDIKQAFVGYREQRISNEVNGIKYDGFISDAADIRKVTSAIANNKKEVIDLDAVYQSLIKSVDAVNDRKTGSKIHLVDEVKQGWGDDYRSKRGKLGPAFGTNNNGTDLAAWIRDNSDWSSLIDLTVSDEDIANQFFNALQEAKKNLNKKDKTKSTTIVTGDDLYKQGILNIDDVKKRVTDAVKAIDAEEQRVFDQVVDNEALTEVYKKYDSSKLDSYTMELSKVNDALEENGKAIIEHQQLIDSANKSGIDATANQKYVDELQKQSEALKVRKQELENNIMAESSIQNELFKQEREIAKQKYSEVQLTQQNANAIIQSQQKIQQAYQNTGNVYNKISRDTSLARDDVAFERMFDDTNQAAQEAKKHFQELLADEKAVISVAEQFDGGNALQSFSVNIKRASGDVESLRYSLINLTEGRDDLDDDWNFLYRGASLNDKNVEKQFEKRAKKANDLQIKLDKIRSEYEDKGHSKPIKDVDHISSLDEQYERVKKAIAEVKNADDSAFMSMVANAETEKAALENMVREYRNAETVATSLRSKDIDTVKATYDSKLDVLISKMRKDGVYTSGFESGAENLRSTLSNATDSSGLIKFLNGLDKIEAGYKRAIALKKEFAQADTHSKRAFGLGEHIKNLQRISPEINEFEVEINGAKVSVQSLLKDLGQVKTKGDFDSANESLKAFKKAAEAAGIAITETAQKTKSIENIKIKLDDTGFNGFKQEVQRAYSEAEKLDGVSEELAISLKRLDAAMKDVYSAKDSGNAKALISANEKYEASLKQVYSQLKLNQQAEKDAYNAEMLDQKRTALSSNIEIWLKDNTMAAKDFGEELRKLQSSLDGLDDKGLRLAGKQFENIKKQAQIMGKTGLTVFDQFKTKIAQYASYLSAAEIFMYAEQAIRSMFEQVKLIDSAMTELKKVTDETEASYDRFLDNAATKAREIGTTIDGLIESTADFARLGYGFEDAQGLAAVANIYAVVGDEIEGVEGATESLISTMAAYRDEMNGMSNTDFAMSIIDSFNELGNTFAISSGGLGEAFKRSASSLAAANNTIHESAALITAANEVTQNPDKVGKIAVPTIKMAISVKGWGQFRPRKDFISIF